METRGIGSTPPPILPPNAVRTLAAQAAPQEALGPTDHFSTGPAVVPNEPESEYTPSTDADPQAVVQKRRALNDTTSADLSALKLARKDLRGTIKASREAPLADQARLHKTLQETQEKLKGVERYKRERTWDKMTAETGHTGEREASPTAQAFFVTGRTPIREMKEVLKVSEELADPNSPRRLRGNKVDVLTRGEVWEKKMELMESAASNPKVNGKPVPVDAEYFELSSPEALEKLNRAARGGARVRVLVDSGRLQPDGENLDATQLANRLNTVKSVENGSRGKAGVQFFANDEVLGSRGDLMHRKLLRVGDTVLFGGMNANAGSGENVDNGMTLEGPAAKNQAEGFQRDLDRSQGRDSSHIFGTQLDDLREKENITLNSQGLLSLTEAAGGQAPKANRSYQERVDTALESAALHGVNVNELADIPNGDARAFLLKGRGSVQMTEKGRNFLADGLQQAVDGMNTPGNGSRLAAGELPSDKAVGTDTVAIGDTSAERTAMLLHAVDTAEKRIDISAFVVSEEVARALVAKRDRMKAEGKPFEARVVMDPGVYGYGGTPNEKGYRYLEDHDIPVKWAVLDRSSPNHDRKVHAKLMVTDQMMLTGSTNFSSKALNANWELSDVLYFGEDEASHNKQEELHRDFDHLWNREAMSVNTRELAERKYADTPAGPERDLLVDRYRDKTTRTFIRGVENYERAIGERVQQEVHSNPTLAYNLEQRVKGGQASGYALWDLMGDERLQALRESTPAFQQLQAIQHDGAK